MPKGTGSKEDLHTLSSCWRCTTAVVQPVRAVVCVGSATKQSFSAAWHYCGCLWNTAGNNRHLFPSSPSPPYSLWISLLTLFFFFFFSLLLYSDCIYFSHTSLHFSPPLYRNRVRTWPKRQLNSDTEQSDTFHLWENKTSFFFCVILYIKLLFYCVPWINRTRRPVFSSGVCLYAAFVCLYVFYIFSVYDSVNVYHLSFEDTGRHQASFPGIELPSTTVMLHSLFL